MEFNEKLQELRRKKGLTQDELAEKLYVSRTAVSKWESGRGYPSIESLKIMSKFFSVTVDELLSSDEIITIAEEDGIKRENRIRNLIFGLLDICVAMLLFLPFFASRIGETVDSVSLLALTSVKIYIKISYFVLIFGAFAFGVVTLALQGCQNKFWQKNKALISVIISVALSLLFILTLQPYPAVFVLILLSIKASILMKK